MMGLLFAIAEAGVQGHHWAPQLGASARFQHWLSQQDMKRCPTCKDQHGKIWRVDETPEPMPPIHPNDRCSIVPMETIKAGTATVNGTFGADYTLQIEGALPGNYVTMKEAKLAGWERGDDPRDFIDDRLITGGEYRNDDGHLPQATGRFSQEADLSYLSGKRGGQRVVWSNDGLVFVTYDHYKTFYEIV